MIDFTDPFNITVILCLITGAVFIHLGICLKNKIKERKRLESDSFALPKSKNSIESLYRDSVAKGKSTAIKKRVKSVEEVAKEIANK